MVLTVPPRPARHSAKLPDVCGRSMGGSLYSFLPFFLRLFRFRRGRSYAPTRSKSLSRHFQKKVQTEEAEDRVGGPSGEQRRQLPDRTHRFGKRRSRPIHNRNSYSGGEAADGAARSHKNRKGNREKDDYGRDQWERELLLQLHG